MLKSTGDAAKVTAREIENLAQKLSRKSGIDDEAIQSGENLLLTFTKIRNETGKGNHIFTRATSTIVDMSVALGQDLKSSRRSRSARRSRTRRRASPRCGGWVSASPRSRRR